mgnify:CR=1 FL=1
MSSLPVRAPAPNKPKAIYHIPNPPRAPSLPAIDIILDPSIIPSLPPPGGLVGHAELMGRPRVIASQSSLSRLVLLLPAGPGQTQSNVLLHRRVNTVSPVPGGATAKVRQSGGGSGRVGEGQQRGMTVPVPVKHGVRRTSSFERLDLAEARGGGRGDMPRLGRREGRERVSSRHQRTASDSTVGSSRRSGGSEYEFQEGLPHSNAAPQGGLPCYTPPRPFPPDGAGAKSSRAEHTTNMNLPKYTKHVEHATHTAVTEHVVADRHARQVRHARASSIPAYLTSSIPSGCIQLVPSDPSETVRLLTKLLQLTPPSRLPDIPLPPATSGLMHPSSLLTPLAIILEALVVERAVLRHETPSPLPVLRDGSSLQMGRKRGVDWTIMKGYIESFSHVMVGLMPYIRKSDVGPVDGLKKGLRVYVGKQKKVFGEVAEMYVDEYGFVRGWWDESGMKQCAKRVGQWGEMVEG